MIEKYKLAYQEVKNRFGEEYPYFSLLVLSLYGLLTKYSSYQDIVIEVFQNTDFYIDQDDLYSIINKNSIPIIDFFEDDNNIEEELKDVPAISSTGKYLETKEQQIQLVEKKPFIACSYNNHTEPSILLNCFVHEFSHLIKAHHQSYFEEEDELEDSHYLRGGIQFYKYSYLKEQEIMEENSYFTSIDEVINVIETTETLEIIKDLDGLVPDKRIQSFLNQLDEETLKKDYGYNDAVKVFRPLWEIESFRNIVEENIVEGNISRIIEEFSSISSRHTFLELSSMIEDVDNYLDDDTIEDAKYLISDICKDIIEQIKVKKRK